MTNAINWFEIPVKKFERAKDFYSSILDIEIKEVPIPQMKYGVFPYDSDNNKTGGAIMQMEGAEPSINGVTVYLDGGHDLALPLSKVEKAGGKIMIPKTDIGENGYIAHFMDTEGNKVALHSWN